MAKDTPVQDYMSFQLRADKVVVSDTVKLTVLINALVTPEKTESALRTEIKQALAKFVEADWQFNGIERSVDDSGFERVSLRATARVNERENYNLDGRAKAVSRQGLQLSSVSVDATVPIPMLEEAEKELRLAILKKANEELEAINGVMGGGYRVAQVNYANQGEPYARKSPGIAASAANFTATSYGSGFGDDEDDSLSNAQKVTLSASIQLARVVAY